ncbi:MAG TPA: fibronectin type III domain-containing protein [Chryseosolibacter sp.]|nr:fibronectin type III domain-containing protein [Chryseosolibacter sp.]
MGRVGGLWGCFLFIASSAFAQVDTSFVYNTSTSYGTLDIRIRKSSTRYYYLQENKTVAFRTQSGVKTNSYFDMTAWDSSPYTQGNLREKNGSADYFVMNYRLLFPLGYQPGYDPGYPLIVMMHGAGERGNCWKNTCYHADRSWNPNTNQPAAPTDATSKLLNNDHNLLHGGKPHLDARNLAGTRLPHDPSMPGRAFPGFVLFAQNLNSWEVNAVQDMIKLVRVIAKKYNIDEDRIYLHGLSNGGAGVYQAVKRAPWLFAAVLPMSATGDNGLIAQNQAANVAHIPFWMFQGGQDTAPTPSLTENYVRELRKAGAIVRYSLYPTIGHSTWNTAYKEPDFFTWILSKNKATIHTFGGSTAICQTNGQGVRMELARGFRAYQWERNGVIISGATSATYTATTTGTYRARFSRKANPGAADWNQWSAPVTITQQSPAAASIVQTGTLILPDLNGYNEAKLSSGRTAQYYYWYKNGVLQNLDGGKHAVQNATFKAGTCSGTCTGNGAYTLVTATADQCPSPRSAPKYVFFNNQAPVNIAAPTNFTGSPSSQSAITLSWSDVSTNETGFEIWRRKVIGTTSYSRWEMRTVTAANARSFVDNGAEPSTTYHYKIRGVSNSGRSNYTPAASNAYLIVKTGADNIAPSAPQTLTAAQSGINAIKLTWKASTDNTGIKQYRIYYSGTSVATGSNATTHTLSNLALNTNYSFTVKAEDLGGNLSAASNAATANTYVTGLYYEHTTGAWTDLDQINWSALPEHTGKVTSFTLSPRVQDDFFNFEFDGYLYINTAGTYQFRTISSDGSRVILNGTVVVENDGIHGTRSVSGPTMSLGAGPKRINVRYFEYDGEHTLTVMYKGPDSNNSWLTIPASALRSGSSASSTMMAMSEETATEPEPAFSAQVYPNPASQENINLVVDSQDESPIGVAIVDFTGNELYRGVIEKQALSDGFRIQIDRKVPEGIYLIVLTQRDKIIKHRISIRN